MNLKVRFLSLGIVLSAALVGCSQVSPGDGPKNEPPKAETPAADPADPTEPVRPPDVKFADVLETVFSKRCTDCHSSLLDPNKAKAMMANIEDRVFVRKTMPPGQALTIQQESILRQWLSAGGPL